MPPVTQSPMLVLTGPIQTGCLPLAGQQRLLDRTTRVETSTQQPSVNRAAGSPQIDTPLPLIPEDPGTGLVISCLSSRTEVFMGLPVPTPGRTLCLVMVHTGKVILNSRPFKAKNKKT